LLDVNDHVLNVSERKVRLRKKQWEDVRWEEKRCHIS